MAILSLSLLGSMLGLLLGIAARYLKVEEKNSCFPLIPD